MCEQLFPHLTDPAPVVVIKVGIEDSETAVALRSVPGPFVFPGKSRDRRVVSFPPAKQHLVKPIDIKEINSQN